MKTKVKIRGIRGFLFPLFIINCSLLISCGNPLIQKIVEPRTVTFESNGGSYVSSQTVFKDRTIKRPPDPKKIDHNFDAWYSDNETFEEEWDFAVPPPGDMTLYANWIVRGIIIYDVDITVDGPAKGNAPAATASSNGSFTIDSVTWSPDHDQFLGNTVYKVAFTLTAHPDHLFTEALTTPYVNGYPAAVASNAGTTLAVSYTFARTDSREVTGIHLTAQPTKLNYTHGDNLDLAGLAVQLTYDTGETEPVVSNDFASKNISTAPGNNALLSHTDHNGKPVTVYHGSITGNITAATNTLTVDRRPLADIALNIAGPEKGDTPAATASGTGNWAEHFTISPITWSPNDPQFLGDVVYTVSIALTALPDYTFAPVLTVKTVNGQPADVGANTGNELTLSHTFARTDTRRVTGMLLTAQPAKLTYIHGETLDLSGLKVQLTFDTGEIEVFEPNDFASENIFTDPTDGEPLSRSDHNGQPVHNGKPVRVSRGNFTANTGNLTVNPKNISAVTVDAIPPQTYNTSPIRPIVTVRDNTTALTLNTDYTVAYSSNNINVGTATATITGIGNYTGSRGENFIINPRGITFTVDPITAEAYNRNAHTPAPIVKDGTTALTPITDYTVGYTNNTNAGTATVTITGAGNYQGSAGSANFTINPRVITFTVDPITAVTYNGSAHTPTVTVKDDAIPLILNTEYTVAYTNNTDAETAAAALAPTAAITGAGNYLGSTGSATFTINKATGASVAAPAAASANVGLTTVTLTAITALTPSTGQSVEYSRSNAGSTASNGTWDTSTTFTGLAAGTTYYFFARSAGNSNYNTGESSSGRAITTKLDQGITITFDFSELLVQDPNAPAFESGITLSRSGVGDNKERNVTITVPYTYDSIRWEIPGVGTYAAQPPVSGDSPTITLDAGEIKYNSPGGHTVEVTVTVGGMQYRGNFIFWIVN